MAWGRLTQEADKFTFGLWTVGNLGRCFIGALPAPQASFFEDTEPHRRK